MGFDVRAHPSTAAHRPHGFTMGVRIDFDPLIRRALAQSSDVAKASSRLTARPNIIESVAERIGHFRSKGTADFIGDADLAVGLSNELERADGQGEKLVLELIDAVMPQVPLVKAHHLHGFGQNAERELIKQSNCICILVLGVVTGTALNRALAAVQGVRRDANLPAVRVGVLAVHVRPESDRDRSTIVNPFGSANFVAVYESLLPFEASPFRAEKDYLGGLSKASELTNSEFYMRRSAFLDGGIVATDDEEPLFWGLSSGLHSQMRPGSLFGESLSPMPTLVAVGSAVQSKRYIHAASNAVPEWRQFEIPAILRSYFDPLIVCSVFRWLQPEECWWGRDSLDGNRLIRELLNNYHEMQEQRLLLAELLLASALGKVPTSAIDGVMDLSRRFVEDHGDSSENNALVFGLKLLEYEKLSSVDP